MKERTMVIDGGDANFSHDDDESKQDAQMKRIRRRKQRLKTERCQNQKGLAC
jgi:hypothetical protein